MIERKITSYIREISSQFSVIGILGPRQSGKTTLARMLFPDYEYINFELPDVRAQAAQDLNAFMHLHPAPVILDEVQRFPQILEAIQVWVDAHGQPPAAFVLTGSNQPHLRGAVSESLAGRIALAYLLPLSFEELRGEVALDRAASIHRGFMPRLYSSAVSPQNLYENYIATYVERDVNQLINLKHAERFLRLLRLLAARVGQLVNYESLANEIGVSAATIQDWISVMEASFIVFRLYPYYENFGKRFVKTPKIYFTDVGLAAHLLGLHTPEEIERNMLFGQLFENMIVANVRKNRFNAGAVQLGSGGMYFMRDKTGNEVDLALEVDGGKLDLIEIKSTMAYSPDYVRAIEKYAKLVGERYGRGSVIYAGSRAACREITFVPFPET